MGLKRIAKLLTFVGLINQEEKSSETTKRKRDEQTVTKQTLRVNYQHTNKEKLQHIRKTRLFKYTDNFTTKK